MKIMPKIYHPTTILQIKSMIWPYTGQHRYIQERSYSLAMLLFRCHIWMTKLIALCHVSLAQHSTSITDQQTHLFQSHIVSHLWLHKSLQLSWYPKNPHSITGITTLINQMVLVLLPTHPRKENIYTSTFNHFQPIATEKGISSGVG